MNNVKFQRYQIAAQLYESSMRSLEQRSMAFLFVQSLLAGSFAILFTRLQGNEDILVPIWGIIVVGFIFSILFHLAGKTVSQDASIWRACMHPIQDNNQDELWSRFRKYSDKFWLQRKCIDKLPAPTLWLFSPAVFFIAWICAGLWMIHLYMPRFTTCCFWVVSVALVLLVSVLCRWCFMRSKTNINKIEATSNPPPTQ